MYNIRIEESKESKNPENPRTKESKNMNFNDKKPETHIIIIIVINRLFVCLMKIIVFSSAINC